MKRINFFRLLESQSKIMLQGMFALDKLCNTNDQAYAEQVIALEKEGDIARKILIEELNKTFITPIDRKDIFSFSRSIDEILDYTKTTVDEIKLFGVVPNVDIRNLTRSLVKMCIHINKAVINIEKHPDIAKEEAIVAKKMENEVANVSIQGLADLFNNADYQTIFKYREIYRHLNQTADIGDEAMDLLLDIIVSL